jgi:GntR family transcriptional regulator / MocR family aminotransferase
MPKKSASYELPLARRDPAEPAYQWLYGAIRSEILSGRLPPGSRLPATRDLARQYRLSRGTIVNAFDLLCAEGYVEGNVGSGTYVSKALPENLLEVRSGDEPRLGVQRKHRFSISNYGKRARLFAGFEERPPRAFRANLPALDLFPVELWAKTTARRLRRLSVLHLMGSSALGYPPLRRAVADYLGRSRGVRCAPGQVVIVSGVQEALDLSARLLVDPGDPVCVEDPGYPGAMQVMQAFKAKITAARLDDEGIIVRQLPLRGSRLVYVTPGHQFPLGITMSLARRLELLRWAEKTGTVIFEDDYDSEYRYSGRPIPALQGLDNHELVIYAGSFSKVLFPALRLGYIVVSSELLSRLEAVLSLTVRHMPLLPQLVLCDFINEGHFERHLRRMREIYAQRLALLLEEARSKLGGLLRITGVEAGLQTVGWLGDGLKAEAAASAASKHRVDVTPVQRYCHATTVGEGLQLGFAAVGDKEIRRGVRDFAIALESYLKCH